MKLTLKEAREIIAQNEGNLDLSYTNITELPDNLTVYGSLILSHTSITKLPSNLTVGGNFYLSYTDITELPDSLAVAGTIFLSNTGITELPDNLTIGGGLILSDTPITVLPDNMTLGLSLYLDLDEKAAKAALATSNNLRLGGTVFSGSKPIHDSEEHIIRYLRNGDYVEGKYLYADGILALVERVEEIGEYTFYHGKIPGRNVVCDGVNFAHCATIEDGIADLAFKKAKDRGAEQYKGLPLDTELTVDDAVAMYRVITGACKQGSADFIRSLGALKEKYTIRECIELTRGQYNAEAFAGFFGC